MRWFRRAVEKTPIRLYIPELCASIGGDGPDIAELLPGAARLSPNRYLLLRRMHLTRRGLRHGTRDGTAVTEIATQYGFWQFGSLAGEYESLFGKAPPATLHRPRE